MEDNKQALKTLVEQLLLKNMGAALDLGRIAIQNDRAMKQYERTMRAETRQLIQDGQKLIDESLS